jgi:hypothetical protein
MPRDYIATMNQYVLIALLHIVIILPLVAYLVWALSKPDEEDNKRSQLLTVAYLIAFLGVWGAIYHGISLAQYLKH